MLTNSQTFCMASPGGSVLRNPPANTGDQVQSLGEKDSLEKEGNASFLQYSCLRNPMDRGIWEATVHGVARVGHEETKTKKKRTVWVSFMYILNFCNFF